MKSSATKREVVWIALILSFTVVAVFASGCAGSSSTETSSGQPAYWPTDAWRLSTPEEQGISSSALLKVLDRVDEQHLNLHSLLVIRNGYLVSEVYYNPFTADMAAPVASVTKSVTGALVGIAIDKGYIKDEQAKVLSFFPNQTIANLDDRKQAMTIRDLVTMTGGLDYTDALDPACEALTQSKDWVSFMLDRPMAASPGTDVQLLDRRSPPSLRCPCEGYRGDTSTLCQREPFPAARDRARARKWLGVRPSRYLVWRRGSIAHAERHGKDRLPLPQRREVGRPANRLVRLGELLHAAPHHEG